jgi:hypothetical protein
MGTQSGHKSVNNKKVETESREQVCQKWGTNIEIEKSERKPGGNWKPKNKCELLLRVYCVDPRACSQFMTWRCFCQRLEAELEPSNNKNIVYDYNAIVPNMFRCTIAWWSGTITLAPLPAAEAMNLVHLLKFAIIQILQPSGLRPSLVPGPAPNEVWPKFRSRGSPRHSISIRNPRQAPPP